MNNEEFVNSIRVNVSEGSINSIKSILKMPSGRKPKPELVELSNWYNNLDNKSNDYVSYIIKEAIEQAVFNFLCVLDGVSAIENIEEKGTLKLFYEKDGNSTLLNNPDNDYLHDTYNLE
jgi:hypothetical protein